MGSDTAVIERYALPAAVTLVGFHQTARFVTKVVEFRTKHNVHAPEIEGPPEFNRIYRAHQNTLEFFTPTFAGLWIGSVLFHPVPASLLYCGYLVGREKYFRGYVESPEKRIPGFMMCLKFIKGLVLLCCLGVGHKLLRYYTNIDVNQIITDKISELKH